MDRGRRCGHAWRRRRRVHHTNGHGYAANPQGVAIADFNRDGHPDIAVANSAPEGLIVWHGPVATFAPTVIPGESYLNVLAIGDLNGDGRLDVAAASTDRGRVAIYLGTATELVFARSYRVDGDTRGITIADVNVDGVPDVITASRSTSSVNVLPGDRRAAAGPAPADVCRQLRRARRHYRRFQWRR